MRDSLIITWFRRETIKPVSAVATCFVKCSSAVFIVAAVIEDVPADLSQPTNLLVTLLTYSSIALQNTKGIL